MTTECQREGEAEGAMAGIKCPVGDRGPCILGMCVARRRVNSPAYYTGRIWPSARGHSAKAWSFYIVF